MKKILVLICLICFYPHYVISKELDNKTFNIAIEKTFYTSKNIIAYEEFLTRPHETGHSIEFFSYYPQQKTMCSLFVVNIFKDYIPSISENYNDNICFGLEEFNDKYFAVNFDTDNYYFYRRKTLYFSKDLKEITTELKTAFSDTFYTWQGKMITTDKAIKTIKTQINRFQ